MKKYLTYFICLTGLLIFPLIAMADTPVTIKVGVYENIPKIFTDKESMVTGFWPDLINYIAAKEGWQIEWVSGTWAQGLKRLKTGEINIMPDTGWTEPRSREYTFSNETVLVSWSRLYVPQNSKIKSIIDLNGKTIAALKGSFNLEGPEGIKELIYKFNLDVTIQEMESYEQIFEALSEGKIDAGVTNKDFGNRQEKNYAVERTAIIFQPARMQFAFTKNSGLTPFLVKKIDAHMKQFKGDKSSVYYQALEKYIGGRPGGNFIEIIPGWVKITLVATCGVILFLFAVGIVSRIQVRRRTFELQESEGKYRTLINNSPDLRYRTDLDGKIVFISPSVLKLSGYTTDEAIGMKMAEDVYASPHQRETFLVALKKNGSVSDFEAQLKRKDGSIWWASTNAYFYKDHNGNTLGVEGVTRDITDRKKLEIQLLQSQKMEAIGTLSGGIAHDFNNILSGIFGYSQLAEINIDNPVKAKEHITQIINGAKRAAELVQQILTYSKQSEYQKYPFKIYIAINEALDLLRSSLPTTIEIKKKIDSNKMILADPTKIHQVIMNLCTNAYHAMSETGGLMIVSLTEMEISNPKSVRNKMIPCGHYLKLEVSDTGHGMDESTLKKAFDPYFTTKQLGKGTGLGLALVQAIVDEHDGFLDVYSEPDKGTNFYIYFPIIKKTAAPHTPTLEKTSSLNGKEKIMFVDDEASIRQISKALIEKYGYTVSLFKDGIEAQEEFEKNPHQFDLAITDMTMPGMTGDKLAAELLKIRPDFPIILCTGFSENISEATANKLGIRKYIQKPIANQDLMVLIREVLDIKL